MRKIILTVAVSLDGFIEGPNGEYDWCMTDQDYGLSDFFKRVDARFLGRKSYELSLAVADEIPAGFPEFQDYVFSTTLHEVKNGAILIKDNIKNEVEKIKARDGKDIWLFGGGKLFCSLAEAGMVDTVEVSVTPILLGAGVPLAPNLSKWIDLSLVNHKVYASGAVSLEYAIRPTDPR